MPSSNSSVVAGEADPRIIGDGTQPGKQVDGKSGVEIEGDRMTKFAPVVMSKQTEVESSSASRRSPGRPASISSTSSGMTEEKHFPTANGSGVAVFDFDNDGLLDIYFATATLLPLGTAEKGPNRLYKNLGNDRVPDRDGEVGPRLSRASATGSIARTSTTTGTSTSFCAITARTCCTSTRATGLSRTSANRPASTRPTGHRVGPCSTTTTTGTSTFT